jgi:DegV family protein with EDD domain
MSRGIVPKTAQIPYDRTYDLFRSCLDSGRDVIYISFSSTMSNCFSLACMAAKELSAVYPDRKIAVIDSKGGSGATGLIVLQALKMADAGAPFEQIESAVRFMAEHIEHEFSVEDLEWLAKGGRIPRIVGAVGSKLGIRPVLDVRNGSICFRKMMRGKRKAIEEVAGRIIAKAADFPVQLVSITHADDIVSAAALEELIKKGLPGCITTISHIGCVLSAHLGLKGIGAYCLNKRPEHYCLI